MTDNSTLGELLRRRTLILFGKGGVGKTTVSGALAMVAARRGARVLLMECDRYAPLAAAFGRLPSFEPIEAAPGLSLMVLDGRAALEEYLHLVLPARAVLRPVLSSRLYQYFVNAAPGLRELMMLGKLYYEAERTAAGRARWDLIVLDAPASGQALSLLRMPFAARRTFGESVVGREARNIVTMLRRAGDLALLEVAIPEPFSVIETLETYRTIDELGLAIGAVMLNRCATADFSEDDVARLARRVELKKQVRHLDRLMGMARAELVRVKAVKDAAAAVRRRTHAPTIELPELPGLSGLALIDKLASHLSGLVAGAIRAQA